MSDLGIDSIIIGLISAYFGVIILIVLVFIDCRLAFVFQGRQTRVGDYHSILQPLHLHPNHPTTRLVDPALFQHRHPCRRCVSLGVFEHR